AVERTGDLEEALSAQREAVRIDGARLGEAIFKEGELLRRLGRNEEAGATYRRAGERARTEGRPGQNKRGEHEIQGLARHKQLFDRLPKLMSGEDRPKDDAELGEIIWLCHDRRLYAAGAQICERTFGSSAGIRIDAQSANRYNAACIAALAGCGQGADALPDADA